MNTQQQPIYVSTLNYNNNYNQNKKYLLVDSRCRADYFNPTHNFTFPLNTTIEITKYCKLVYASIPNTYYLINTYNNHFNIELNGTSYIVT